MVRRVNRPSNAKNKLTRITMTTYKRNKAGELEVVGKGAPKEIKRDFCGNPIKEVPEVTTTTDEEDT